MLNRCVQFCEIQDLKVKVEGLKLNKENDGVQLGCRT